MYGCLQKDWAQVVTLEEDLKARMNEVFGQEMGNLDCFRLMMIPSSATNDFLPVALAAIKSLKPKEEPIQNSNARRSPWAARRASNGAISPSGDSQMDQVDMDVIEDLFRACNLLLSIEGAVSVIATRTVLDTLVIVVQLVLLSPRLITRCLGGGALAQTAIVMSARQDSYDLEFSMKVSFLAIVALKHDLACLTSSEVEALNDQLAFLDPRERV